MSVRRSLAWMALGQGSFFVFQFVSSIIIARLLKPYEMGVFAIALATIGVLSVIQSLSLNNLLVREHELGERLLASAFTVNLLIAAALSSLIAGAAFLGDIFFNEPGVRSVLLVLSVTPLIGALTFLPGALLEREGNFRAVAMFKSGGALVTGATAVFLAYRGYSYMSLAYGQLIASVVISIVVAIAGRRYLRFRLSLADWRMVTRFGAQMLAIAGVLRISRSLADMMLGKIQGLGTLGLYSRANNVHNMLWENLLFIITRVVFIDFAGFERQGGHIRERYLRVIEIITALLWPAFGGLAILSLPLVRALYGPNWDAAALPLSILCIGSAIHISMPMTWEIFVLRKQTGLQTRIEFIRSGTTFALFIAGAFVSIVAAAAARIGDAIIAQILYRKHLMRFTETTWGDVIPIYLRSALLTAAALLPAALLMLLASDPKHLGLIPVLASAAAGFAAWALLLKLTGHPIAEEARKLIDSRRPARAAPSA
jgi:O-antigen/teichoic acid export membrane protein